MKYYITKHCKKRYIQRVLGGSNISSNILQTIFNDLNTATNITSKLSEEVPRFILHLKETYGNKGYTILKKGHTIFPCIKRKGTKDLYDVVTCYVDLDDLKMFRNTVLSKDERIKKARNNAEKGGYSNVEFRLGEIEQLPVESNSIDVIISNCVINLSPDKKQVFQVAFRTLKQGGRFIVSDIVLLKKLPDFIKNSIEAYIGCISGAIMKDKYIGLITEAGFQEITSQLDPIKLMHLVVKPIKLRIEPVLE